MNYYRMNPRLKSTNIVDPVLNNNSWATIQAVAQAGNGADYWQVGDRKEIVLNGTCRARTFDNYKVYAYILGFNHNEALEGRAIHFQIGFDDLTDGVPIVLTDSYGTKNTGFCMNNVQTNAGGWNGSFMRTTIIPEFISCLPSDLQDALKAVNKYTDNTGNASDVAANVTATQDKVFLLAEYEIFGSRTYANQYEQNSQARYDYYKNGNSNVMYNDQSTSTAVYWWERSADYRGANGFNRVDGNGSAYSGIAHFSMGFAPAFTVG
jgi:hypothetical protein